MKTYQKKYTYNFLKLDNATLEDVKSFLPDKEVVYDKGRDTIKIKETGSGPNWSVGKILTNEAYISLRNDGVVSFHSEQDFKDTFKGI